MKRIVLHIDKLLLHGFKHEDRHGIAAGLKQELGQLLSNPQAAHQLMTNGDVSRLRVGNVRIGQNVKSKNVGMQLAHGISQGIKR